MLPMRKITFGIYNMNMFRLFDATDSEFVSQFTCPQFLGCVVTSSGIKQKDEIKDLVTKGGTWPHDFLTSSSYGIYYNYVYILSWDHGVVGVLYMYITHV